MAYQVAAPRSLLAPLSRAFDAMGAFLGRIGTVMVMNSQGQRKLERVQHLQAKTDAQLAQMGIKRDDIIQHVFRDLYML